MVGKALFIADITDLVVGKALFIADITDCTLTCGIAGLVTYTERIKPFVM